MNRWLPFDCIFFCEDLKATKNIRQAGLYGRLDIWGNGGILNKVFFPLKRVDQNCANVVLEAATIVTAFNIEQRVRPMPDEPWSNINKPVKITWAKKIYEHYVLCFPNSNLFDQFVVRKFIKLWKIFDKAMIQFSQIFKRTPRNTTVTFNHAVTYKKQR